MSTARSAADGNPAGREPIAEDSPFCGKVRGLNFIGIYFSGQIREFAMACLLPRTRFVAAMLRAVAFVLIGVSALPLVELACLAPCLAVPPQHCDDHTTAGAKLEAIDCDALDATLATGAVERHVIAHTAIAGVRLSLEEVRPADIAPPGAARLSSHAPPHTQLRI